MKTEKQRLLALIGALCGAAYLTFNRLWPSLPDFLLGVLVGLSLVLLIVGLLPAENWRKLRKWKRRGE